MKIPTIINFKDLILASRIFETTPPAEGKYLYLAIVFIIFFLAGLAVWFFDYKIKKDYRQIFARITTLLITSGSIGLILVLLRTQQVPYLGSRFIMDCLVLVIILWVAQIIIYCKTGWRKEIEKKLEKQNFEKYLPKNYKI